MFLSNPIIPVNGHDQNQTVNWWGEDTEKLYKTNLKMHNDYLSCECFQNIKYSFNEFGYRTDPFDKIDWNNSVLMFGCSICFGSGLKYEHTIGEQLSSLIGNPIINLGVNGGSPNVQLMNTIFLLEYFKKINVYPKAVIYIWPSLDRFPVFDQKESCLHNLGSWNTGIPTYNKNYEHLFKYFSMNGNMHIQNQLAIHICNNLLWNNIPVIYESYNEKTADFLNRPQILIIDKARDMTHPGPITSKKTANHFAAQLNLS